MAILFMEGFDGHATRDEVFADERIGAMKAVSASNYDLVTGRSGSGNALMVDGATAGFITRLSSATSDTIWMQFAYKITQLPTNPSYPLEIVRLYDTTGVQQGTLVCGVGGVVTYRRGDYNDTIVSTASSSLGAGGWYYIELKVKFDNTTGTVLMKVDGSEEINDTGLDTLNGGVASIVSCFFGYHLVDGVYDPIYDDFVIGDTSGTDATDLLGDCSIEILHPDGAGNYSQFTPLSGSNYQNVDEGTTQDGDTSYNSSSTAGHKDSFTCDNLAATSGSVHAVQITTVSKKGDGGGRKLRGLVRESVTDALGTGKYVPATYTHRSDLFENDPAGSNWTVSTVNSMEIGYELET